MAARTRTSGPRWWLFKTEPTSFSFADLEKAPRRRTGWTGVRNHQAKLILRDEVHAGDLVLVYHSSADPSGVFGIARVVGEASPDPTQFDPADEHFDARAGRAAPIWIQVEIEAVVALLRPVSLPELRAEARLAGMALLRRGQRLSIQPVAAEEARVVLGLAGLDPDDFAAASPVRPRSRRATR